MAVISDPVQGGRERLLEALRELDPAAAMAAVESLIDGGMPPVQVVEQVIGPAQIAVGDLWQENRASVADEHAATNISEGMVRVLSAALPHPPPGAPSIVLACAEGEWHTLAVAVVAMSLRAAGLRVLSLGPSTPAEHLDAFLSRTRPVALGVSCSLPLNLPAVRGYVRVAHLRQVPVIAGGRAFGAHGERAALVGADAFAARPDQVPAIVERWRRQPPELAPQLPASAGGGLAPELAERREALVGRSYRSLEALLPAMAAYDDRQRARTVEDLAYLVDFLRVAVDLGDPSILGDYLAWVSEVLVARSVPRVAMEVSLAAVIDALDWTEAGAALLEAAAGEAGYQPGKHRVTAATGGRSVPRASPGLEDAPLALMLAERRAAVYAAAVEVAAGLSGLTDAAEVASRFAAEATDHLGLEVAVALPQPSGGLVVVGGPHRQPPAEARRQFEEVLGRGHAHATHGRAGSGVMVPVRAGEETLAVLSVAGPPALARGLNEAAGVLAGVLATALAGARLETDTRAKSTLLSILGHELHTPLNAVSGYAQMLHRGSAGPLTERQERYLEAIEQGADRLSRIADNVLDLTAAEALPVLGEPEPVEVAAVAAQVIAALAALAARSQVRVASSISPGLTVAFDRQRLTRVLLNLVHNAISFSPAGARVRISARSTSRKVVLEVADQGPGMEAELMERLGVEFTQQEHGFTRSHEGLGLGIAVAQRLLAKGGGSLRFRPGRRGGTVAVIELAGRS